MIILTGGAGFIGSAILAMLNARGEHDIIVVDHLGRSSKWRNLLGKRFREYIPHQRFLEQVSTQGLPKDTSAVIHMGACSSTTEQDADYLMEVNVRYTQILATQAIERGIRFIYASSGATYGNGEHGYADDVATLDTLRPLNRYGFSKHLVDLWMRDTKRLGNAVGLKFFNVYGPNEYHKGSMASLVYKSHGQLMREGRISLFRSYRREYTDGEQKRDFIYVRDCTAVISWLLDTPKCNGLFNVGSGTARSWNDLARAVFSATKTPSSIHYIDMPVELQTQYQYFTEAPMAKLKEAGFKTPPTTLEAGVHEYVDRYLKHNEGIL